MRCVPLSPFRFLMDFVDLFARLALTPVVIAAVRVIQHIAPGFHGTEDWVLTQKWQDFDGTGLVPRTNLAAAFAVRAAGQGDKTSRSRRVIVNQKIEASSLGVWGGTLRSSSERDAPGSDNLIISGVGPVYLQVVRWWMTVQGVAAQRPFSPGSPVRRTETRPVSATDTG